MVSGVNIVFFVSIFRWRHWDQVIHARTQHYDRRICAFVHSCFFTHFNWVRVKELTSIGNIVHWRMNKKMQIFTNFWNKGYEISVNGCVRILVECGVLSSKHLRQDLGRGQDQMLVHLLVGLVFIVRHVLLRSHVVCQSYIYNRYRIPLQKGAVRNTFLRHLR